VEEDNAVSLDDVSWDSRVFTPRYAVQCWMEQYRECPTEYVWRNFLYWYTLGKSWGWDEESFLNEARKVIVVPVERSLPPQFWPDPSLQAR